MNAIISTSDLQKNIGRLSREIDAKSFTVINNGKPKMVVLPYFEENSSLIEEYLEEYQMKRNQKKLQKELQESLESGVSNFSI